MTLMVRSSQRLASFALLEHFSPADASHCPFARENADTRPLSDSFVLALTRGIDLASVDERLELGGSSTAR